MSNVSDTYDVVGIGNAIVDVLARVSHEELKALGLNKGGMTLVDEATAESLYAKMGQTTECSGGSVANTLAGLASLGASCAFIGKVKNDALGESFKNDIRAVGVTFDTPSATEGPATARCMIFVTPEGQRTMNTYLGACTRVAAVDIDEQLISQSKVLYVEGYLWDQPNAVAAILKAVTAASKAGRETAFTLSDPSCVKRHRDDFLNLVKNHLSILFANENELMALYDCTSLQTALQRLSADYKDLAFITCSERGCYILHRGTQQNIPGELVDNVVDSTGAGDLFAAGVLYGYTQGWMLEECARLGNRCAAQIIQQIGARSQVSLKDLAA